MPTKDHPDSPVPARDDSDNEGFAKPKADPKPTWPAGGPGTEHLEPEDDPDRYPLGSAGR